MDRVQIDLLSGRKRHRSRPFNGTSTCNFSVGPLSLLQPQGTVIKLCAGGNHARTLNGRQDRSSDRFIL